jgi:hypothetical protein
VSGFASPYPGLRPFAADEGDLFFGREDQVDELLRRLHSSRFLAVVGPSGCGKSSLVLAGMIAALESGFLVSAGSHWRFAAMRPGGRPMTELASALVTQTGVAASDSDEDSATAIGLLGATLRRGPLGLVEALGETPLPEGTNLLVLVDQFEEIFRFRREGGVDEADAFIALLLESARQRDVPIYIVLTMRSDFFGDCAAFAGLPEALNRSQYLTPRLSREQRRAAIVGPARVFGGDVAPDLVNRLLNEMGNDPDQLPLMQHLLMRMWTWRSPPAETTDDAELSTGAPRVLTLADYAAVGGLRHALSNHANEAFDSLTEHQRGIAEMLFRRLSERAPGSRDIRRPTEAGEVASLAGATLAELVQVVDIFRAPGCSFVVPPLPRPIEATTVLDITHEALIRQWDRLRDWADDEAQSAEHYRFLLRNAQLWQQARMALWGTPNLEMALDWRTRTQPTAVWANRYGGDFALAMEFLDASAAARAEQEAAERAARTRQVRHLRRVAAVSVAMALLFAGTLGGIYWFEFAEHVAYYKSFVRHWGEPVGIDALSGDHVSHRKWSLKFVQRGIHFDPNASWYFTPTTNEIEAVDADDDCTPDNNVATHLSEGDDDGFSATHECRWRFVRDATTGQIVYENAYDKHGNMRYGYQYLVGQDDRHSRQAYYVGANGSLAHFKNSTASVVRTTYSDRGEEIEVTYFDRDGEPRTGPDHAYGRRVGYDKVGRWISITSLDKDGKPIDDTAGNATLRAEYDSAGDRIRTWALDASGQPTMFKSGYSEHHDAFDQYGNSISSAYFDGDGRPALNQDGIHLEQMKRDAKGQVLSYAYFDRDDKPAISTDGYHELRILSLGVYGLSIDKAVYDSAGQKTTDRDGVFEHRLTRDQDGNILDEKVYDKDGRPISAQDGCFEVRQTLDRDGNVTEVTCFDQQGKPTLTDTGNYRAVIAYDDRGNVIQRAYFDSDGEPATVIKGFHAWRARYDVTGKMSEQAYFDVDDHPVNIADNYQKYVAEHDDRGNQTSLTYYDADGQLVVGPDGFVRRVTEFDKHDDPIETSYYDENGHLTDTNKAATGFASVRRTYDTHWRITAFAYFDRDGQPKARPNGVAVERVAYTGDFEESHFFDAQGRMISLNGCIGVRDTTGNSNGKTVETACLDAEDHPVTGTDGSSIKREARDDHGNVIETSWFDMNGKPAGGSDGIAVMKRRYDSADHKTEEAYFGNEGKPTLGPDGAAVLKWRYDDYGHRTEAAWFGPDGERCNSKSGYAIMRVEYDARGNEAQIAYFGADEKPVAIAEGYHRVFGRYDDRRHITERRFFGIDEKLVNLPQQFAIRRTKYDEHGRILEDAYFDAGEQPAVVSAGYHRVAVSYDEHGNELEKAWFGADGKLIEPSAEVYAMRRLRYDELGRLVEEAYFGADGKPLAPAKGYYRRVVRFTGVGGSADETYFTADNKPFQPFAVGFARSRIERALYGEDGRLVAHCPVTAGDFGDTASKCKDAGGNLVVRRVIVAKVYENSQAAAMDLRQGDVLEYFAGQAIRMPSDIRALTDQSVTDARKLVVRRGNRRLEIDARPGRIGVSMEGAFVPAGTDEAGAGN